MIASKKAAIWSDKIATIVSFGFVCLVILFSAQGPLQEFVKWAVPLFHDDFDGLSRRLQRVAYREGPIGGTFQFLKIYIFSKSAIFLGVPLLSAYMIVILQALRHPERRNLNLLLLITTIVIFGYWIISLFIRDNALIYEPEWIDYILFPLGILITLVLTKRHFGNFIVGFAIFWIVYLFIKGYIPEWVPVLGSGAGHDTFVQNFNFITQAMWIDTGGIYGAPLQIVSRNVLIFIVFGAVLMSCGAGDLLMKLANVATGKFTGGAAHAAVAASAMFGTVSGAAISNVVSTGVMTIPVIKRAGFKPAFSGAVEAAASTGGQVVPPVMGVVAFFVAAEIGLDYRYIMVAAITPALFYYFGVFLTVYFEAKRMGIGGMAEADIPTLSRTEKLQTLVFIIPLAVLTYFLVTQPSITKAGFYGFCAALLSALVFFPQFRSAGRIASAMSDAGKMAAQIIVIVAMIGLIIGLLNISGFNGRLALFLTQLASGPLFFVLGIVAVGAIILGMGLPPGATYFIIVIALSSGIDTVALPALTLHLFVVFFAVMSTVTPPVALAAFAAAPIAGANPLETGWQASRLAIGGFIIPFIFAYHPAVLYKLQVVFEWFGSPVKSNAMIDIALVSWLDYFWICGAYMLAMWLIASALAGYDKSPLRWEERGIRIICGFAVLVPNIWVAGAALIAAIGVIVMHHFAALRAGSNP